MANRSSSSRPTNGGSGALPRFDPPISLMTRTARQAASWLGLPLSGNGSTGTHEMDAEIER